MRKALGVLAIAAGLGIAAPANAQWTESGIAPPGYPWAACAAPYDCGGTLYTRRIVGQRGALIRHHQDQTHSIQQRIRYAVHRPLRPHRTHAAPSVRGAFQYIDDPQLVAVIAWGDIVNAEAYRR